MTVKTYDSAGREKLVADNPEAVVSTANSTTTALASGGSFVGTAEDILTYNQLTVTLVASPSTAKASLFLEFSDDATNWDISVPVFVEDPTYFIPYPLAQVKRYFRLRYLNDGGVAAVAILGGTAGTPTAQTAASFRLTTLFQHNATKELTRTLAQSITEHQPVVLSRSVATGQQPNGSFSNNRSSGSVPSNSSTVVLAGGAAFTGAAQGSTGFSSIMVMVYSDQVSGGSGLTIQWSETSNFALVHFSQSRDYLTTSVGRPFFFPVQLGEFFRVVYTNGPTLQTQFVLRTELLTEAAQLTIAAVTGPMDDNSIAAHTRANLVAKNPSGVYANIERGPSGGLEAHIDAMRTWNVQRLTVGTTEQQITSAGTGRRTINVKNVEANGANDLIYIRQITGVTTSNGYTLGRGNDVSLDIADGAQVWVIASVANVGVAVMEVFE